MYYSNFNAVRGLWPEKRFSNTYYMTTIFHEWYEEPPHRRGWHWWRHQMEIFSALLDLCAGIHRSPVNSLHKGQWRGALIFSLICVWINGWVNNREAGDLRRYRVHCDVIVMHLWCNMMYLLRLWITLSGYVSGLSQRNVAMIITLPPVTSKLASLRLSVCRVSEPNKHMHHHDWTTIGSISVPSWEVYYLEWEHPNWDWGHPKLRYLSWQITSYYSNYSG